uniref:CSON005737 protein n=1 Tax=Culicoides sonorensis TaxID=179676 RepID=A0A336KFB8_CULSO
MVFRLSDSYYWVITLNSTVTSTISPASLQPYFDFNVQRNITVTVGQTGFLNCRVERLGDKDILLVKDLNTVLNRKKKQRNMVLSSYTCHSEKTEVNFENWFWRNNDLGDDYKRKEFNIKLWYI